MELQAEPTAKTTPMAISDFFSGAVLILMFVIQDDSVIAQTKWRSSVKGVMVYRSIRLNKTPTPEAIRALDDETSVRLSHLGVVSKRR
jgi:hypothetical protein